MPQLLHSAILLLVFRFAHAQNENEQSSLQSLGRRTTSEPVPVHASSDSNPESLKAHHHLSIQDFPAQDRRVMARKLYLSHLVDHHWEHNRNSLLHLIPEEDCQLHWLRDLPSTRDKLDMIDRARARVYSANQEHFEAARLLLQPGQRRRALRRLRATFPALVDSARQIMRRSLYAFSQRHRHDLPDLPQLMRKYAPSILQNVGENSHVPLDQLRRRELLRNEAELRESVRSYRGSVEHHLFQPLIARLNDLQLAAWQQAVARQGPMGHAWLYWQIKFEVRRLAARIDARPAEGIRELRQLEGELQQQYEKRWHGYARRREDVRLGWLGSGKNRDVSVAALAVASEYAYGLYPEACRAQSFWPCLEYMRPLDDSHRYGMPSKQVKVPTMPGPGARQN